MVQQIILIVYVALVAAGTVLAIVSECKNSWCHLSPEKMGMMLFLELLLCVAAFLLCLSYSLFKAEYWWFALMLLPIVAGRITERIKKR